MLDAAAERAGESGAELSTIDGYRLDYGDAWVLARPSGTEPVVRVYAEAMGSGCDTEEAAGLVESIFDMTVLFERGRHAPESFRIADYV
jgi:phosphomannomutase/phosphoglucomutase